MTIGCEEAFSGVIDLIQRKAIVWNEADMGMTFSTQEIPEALENQVESMREVMVEAAAEANDELMNAYLDAGRSQ